MADQSKITDALASAGTGVETRMRESVEAILDLVWDARSDKFAFADNPDIDAEVNRILAMMADGMLEDARNAARDLLRAVEYDDWEDEALAYAEGAIAGQTTLFRFDMQASHLKELLEGWIVVAAVYGLAKTRVWTDLKNYMANPLASRMWRGAGLGPLRWGKGYVNNLIEANKRLMRDYISRAYHYAELQRFSSDGATGYTIHRGSTYICPLCDSYTGKVWPLDTVILPIHPACMCYTKPVTEDD